MSRYIDAETAIEKFNEAEDYKGYLKGDPETILNSIPTADVKRVVHARWIETESEKMYKSPIELVFKDPLWEFTQAIEHETDEMVIKCVNSTGIDVDKEELVKALEYDRGQYDKGYADGKHDAAAHAHWIEGENEDDRCSNCREIVRRYVTAGQMDRQNYEGATFWGYCPHCGAIMDGEADNED